MKSLLKKVLPVIGIILLIIIIAGSVQTAKKRKSEIPDLGDEMNAEYLHLSEKVGDLTFDYSVSKGELFERLRKQIGLSTVITMANKEILKNEIKKDTEKSYWESLRDEDIKKEINEAVYGENNVDENGNITLTDDEEKEKAEKKFVDTMFTGYGYKTTDDEKKENNGIYGEEIKDHYRLILAKRLYGKDSLHREIEEKEDYFDREKIDDYFDNHYGKDYSALIVAFKSEKQAELLLLQYGLKYDSDSGEWKKITVEEIYEEDDEDKKGTGIFKTVMGDKASVYEIVDTFIKMYNKVNEGSVKGSGKLTEGEVEVVKDEKTEARSFRFTEGCDYAVLDLSEEKQAVTDAVQKIENLKEKLTVEEKEEAYNDCNSAVKAFQNKIAEETGTEKLLGLLEEYKAHIEVIKSGDTSPEEIKRESDLIEEIKEITKTFEDKVIVFHKENKDSVLQWENAELRELDATLGTKLENSYTTYFPFYTVTDDKDRFSLNDRQSKWFSKTPFQSFDVYYYVIKLGEGKKPTREAMKKEIIGKLEEEALTDTLIEKEMCRLRKDYGFTVFDPELEEEYKKFCKKHDVEYKEAGKKEKLTAKAEKDGFSYKIKAEDFFEYMEKTLGLATAVGKVTRERMIANPTMNKYYNKSEKKWIGSEGKKLKKTIADNIEMQRMNFLSGAYAHYGYDPREMTWKDFMFAFYGVDNEKDYAEAMLFSETVGDYREKKVGIIVPASPEKDETAVQAIDKFNVSDQAEYDKALEDPVWKVLENGMNAVTDNKFKVNGEHLLISVYKSVKDAVSKDGKPLNPSEWNDNQKELAERFIEDICSYLEYTEGSYKEKLQAIVKAFDEAPYDVEDEGGNDVFVVNDDNQPYRYVFEYPTEGSDGKPSGRIDLAAYKTAGLSVKYENLGSFTDGKMVKPFDEAVREIWEKDRDDGKIEDRITVYEKDGKHFIETEFGYHLYINLGSKFASTYKTRDLKDSLPQEGEERIIPTLYEIRVKNKISAYEKLLEADAQADDKDKDKLDNEERERIEGQIKDLKKELSKEAEEAIQTYYDEVFKELSGNDFIMLLQQRELRKLKFPDDANLTEDLIKLMDINQNTIITDKLKYLKQEDLDAFDISDGKDK